MDWDPAAVENGGWYTVTASIKIEYQSVYGRRGPVLHVTGLTPAEPPKREVATFY